MINQFRNILVKAGNTKAEEHNREVSLQNKVKESEDRAKAANAFLAKVGGTVSQQKNAFDMQAEQLKREADIIAESKVVYTVINGFLSSGLKKDKIQGYLDELTAVLNNGKLKKYHYHAGLAFICCAETEMNGANLKKCLKYREYLKKGFDEVLKNPAVDKDVVNCQWAEMLLKRCIPAATQAQDKNAVREFCKEFYGRLRQVKANAVAGEVAAYRKGADYTGEFLDQEVELYMWKGMPSFKKPIDVIEQMLEFDSGADWDGIKRLRQEVLQKAISGVAKSGKKISALEAKIRAKKKLFVNVDAIFQGYDQMLKQKDAQEIKSALKQYLDSEKYKDFLPKEVIGWGEEYKEFLVGHLQQSAKQLEGKDNTLYGMLAFFEKEAEKCIREHKAELVAIKDELIRKQFYEKYCELVEKRVAKIQAIPYYEKLRDMGAYKSVKRSIYMLDSTFERFLELAKKTSDFEKALSEAEKHFDEIDVKAKERALARIAQEGKEAEEKKRAAEKERKKAQKNAMMSNVWGTVKDTLAKPCEALLLFAAEHIVGVLVVVGIVVAGVIVSNKASEAENMFNENTPVVREEVTEEEWWNYLKDEVIHETAQLSSSATLAKDFTYTLQTYPKTYIVIDKYNGTDAEVEIPAVIDGVNVCEIGRDAFQGNSYLEKVIVPDTVLYIGAGAFADCTNLAELECYGNLTYIGWRAFANCTALKTVELTGKKLAVATLGDGAFINCTGLEWVSVDTDCDADVNFAVGKNCFENCTNLQSVGINGENLKSVFVNEAAFKQCNSLSTLDFWDKITEMGRFVFLNCTSLQSASLSGMQNQAVQRETFAGCTSLKTFHVGRNLTGIDMGAFNGCTSLSIVTFEQLPKGEQGAGYGIGDNAFANTAIEEIEIPGNYDWLGKRVFENCQNLKKVVWHANGKNTLTQTTNEWVFAQCNNLSEVYLPATVSELDYRWDFTEIPDCTIYAKEGSVGHTFAVDQGVNWQDWTE